MKTGNRIDLLVVGAGPTGISIGAEARRAGLSTLLVDRGPLVAALLDFPVDMTFFTTRERLEVAGVPFTVPDDKPNRRQAIVYYQAVAKTYDLPIARHEDVVAIRPQADGEFLVETRSPAGPKSYEAGAVAVATGYFTNPKRLDVPGEDLPWVHARFRDPLTHFGERVVVIGAGNSGAEAALELFRHGAAVTLVHRGETPKATIKYWVRPDLENRIAEGSIAARFGARVVGFVPGAVEIERAGGRELLACEAAYVLIGYEPETGILASAGVPVDAATGVPAFDPATCETPVPGLFVAGTVQAGKETHRIFIENSRDHGPLIVRELLRRRGTSLAPGAGAPGDPRGGVRHSTKESS
ncbi:MAG: YpdA family putative bacillithiol disulfide reductase [Thermoanaerobaculia bacterium]